MLTQLSELQINIMAVLRNHNLKEIITLESILCLSSDSNPLRGKERNKEKTKIKQNKQDRKQYQRNILRDKYLPNY